MSETSAHMLEWSWLRDFAAVAAAGSLTAAARQLGLSQATLTRRMAALEEQLGGELLRRTSRGVELTELGEALVGPIGRMGEEVEQAILTATGRDAALRGPVRVSLTEGLAVHFVTPRLLDFCAAHPDIELSLDVRSRNANLLRREADIALRLGRPRQPDLVARRVGDISLGLYATRRYLESFPIPETQADLVGHRMVGFDDTNLDTVVGRRAESVLRPGRIVLRSTSLLAQLEAIRAGVGIGFASDFLVTGDPEFVRVLPEQAVRMSLWLVTHPGLRRSARIRAVFDCLADMLDGDRDILLPDPAKNTEELA